jgi:hypothetical protein
MKRGVQRCYHTNIIKIVLRRLDYDDFNRRKYDAVFEKILVFPVSNFDTVWFYFNVGYV